MKEKRDCDLIYDLSILLESITVEHPRFEEIVFKSKELMNIVNNTKKRKKNDRLSSL